MKQVHMPGDVYFITDGEAIKIGYSGSAGVRLKALQSSHPKPLRILHTIPGSMDDERRLHRQFEHLRIHGEWFRPEQDLWNYIDSTMKPPEAPVEVAPKAPPAMTDSEIAEIRKAVAVWSQRPGNYIKVVCNSIESLLTGIFEGRNIWQPRAMVAYCIEGIDRELAHQRAGKRPS